MSPWVNNEFKYSKWLLERIAKSYKHIYDRIVLDTYTMIVDGYTVERERIIQGEQNLIEYKVDFERALSKLGQSRYPTRSPKLDLSSCEFKNYSHYSRLQQIIIASILGIQDEELMDRGFYRIPNMKMIAYSLMAKYLNSAHENESHS